jgi:hypothetical protein
MAQRQEYSLGEANDDEYVGCESELGGRYDDEYVGDGETGRQYDDEYVGCDGESGGEEDEDDVDYDGSDSDSDEEEDLEAFVNGTIEEWEAESKALDLKLSAYSSTAAARRGRNNTPTTLRRSASVPADRSTAGSSPSSNADEGAHSETEAAPRASKLAQEEVQARAVLLAAVERAKTASTQSMLPAAAAQQLEKLRADLRTLLRNCSTKMCVVIGKLNLTGSRLQLRILRKNLAAGTCNFVYMQSVIDTMNILCKMTADQRAVLPADFKLEALVHLDISNSSYKYSPAYSTTKHHKRRDIRKTAYVLPTLQEMLHDATQISECSTSQTKVINILQ